MGQCIIARRGGSKAKATAFEWYLSDLNFGSAAENRTATHWTLPAGTGCTLLDVYIRNRPSSNQTSGALTFKQTINLARDGTTSLKTYKHESVDSDGKGNHYYAELYITVTAGIATLCFNRQHIIDSGINGQRMLGTFGWGCALFAY